MDGTLTEKHELLSDMRVLRTSAQDAYSESPTRYCGVQWTEREANSELLSALVQSPEWMDG